MKPWIRLTMMKAVWPYAWVKFVRGFAPRQCCARCLTGRFWAGIPWEKHEDGDVFEGELEFDEPFAYLCLVNTIRYRPENGVDKNVHLPMRKNPRSRWIVETDEVRIEARGLQRLLPIPALPAELAPRATAQQAACRCFRWAAATWPARLRGAEGTPNLFTTD